MKLFNRKAGNKTINYNGKNVKFVNCVAEVEDDFGKEVLKLGIMRDGTTCFDNEV